MLGKKAAKGKDEEEGEPHEGEDEQEEQEGEAAHQFTAEQLQSIHRKIDEDGDGKLSPDEHYDFSNKTRCYERHG